MSIKNKSQVINTNNKKHGYLSFEISVLSLLICLEFVSSFCRAELLYGPPSPPLQKSSNREQRLEKQLWQDNLSSLRQSNENSKTEELKQMIEQIRSIQFETLSASQTEPQATEQAELQQQEIPEDKNQKPELKQPGDAVAVTKTNNDKSMSKQTLQKVEQLLKDSNSITNPFELGEVLFQMNELASAGVCYKKALASLGTDDPNVATERAWILFQIGNCFKDIDPNTSKESYAELIRTASDSPWAQIAKSRHGLIDWYQQEQPGKLIDELNR